MQTTARQPAPAIAPNHFFLEASRYTDPAWLPLEQQYIFRKTWLYVGDALDLAEPGAVKAVEVAGTSLLIARTETGSLNAFHNVCPHRASPFYYDDAVHVTKTLVCPYHGWVYGLDGQLKGAPMIKRFPDGFSCADFPLQAVRIEEWEEFMFVCFDEAAPSLVDYLNPIPRDMQGYRTASTQRLLKRNYEVACNWKNFHDNTLCDYHVPIAHRETLSPVQGPVALYQHEFSDYVNLLYTPTTPDWRAANPVLEHLPDRNRLGFFTYGIFPNLHMFALPNGVFGWVSIIPRTVGTSTISVEVYGTPGISPTAEAIAADFNATTQEDIILTEGVQRGYASGAYTAGVANGLEARIMHQQALIRKFMDGVHP